jgi:hypothetical protein
MAAGNPKLDGQGRTILDGPGPYPVAAEKHHRFVLDVPTFTLAIMKPPGEHGEYPIYFLKADDGTYQARSVRDHAVPGDNCFLLRFTFLPKGCKFTLIQRDSVSHETVLFEDRPFEDLVDQPRPDLTAFLERGGVNDLAVLKPADKKGPAFATGPDGAKP